MVKLSAPLLLGVIFAAFSSCSDDDGANVPRNEAPGGSGGSGQGGSAMDAGIGGSAAGASAAGASGASGAAAGGAAGAAGSGPGCTPVSLDAGLDAGLTDAGNPDASSDGGGIPAVVSFATDIHPIFAASCGPCHVEDGSAGHNVGGELMQAYIDAVALGQDLVDRVNGGGMPPSYADPPNDCDGNPGDPGCLTVREVTLIQTWIAQCNPR